VQGRDFDQDYNDLETYTYEPITKSHRWGTMGTFARGLFGVMDNFGLCSFNEKLEGHSV
jgi:hypothetical protein